MLNKNSGDDTIIPVLPALSVEFLGLTTPSFQTPGPWPQFSNQTDATSTNTRQNRKFLWGFCTTCIRSQPSWNEYIDRTLSVGRS